MSEEVTESDELFNGYLSHMEYFATGEGLTIELLLSYCDTPEQAREKHLDKFVGERKEARDYFGRGVEVHLIESQKARDLLEKYFKNIQWLHPQLVDGGIEFSWKFYVNHS